MLLSVRAMIVLDCVCQVANTLVQGPRQTMSRDTAFDRCDSLKKRLVSYRDIQGDPSKQDFISNLGNGESAWIEGYAQYSRFLAWRGCFKSAPNLGIHIFAVKRYSLFLCTRQCRMRNLNAIFVGVRRYFCYCITKEQRAGIVSVNGTFCDISCADSAVDSCGGERGGNRYISIYRIIEDQDITWNWGREEPKPRQCVYVKRSYRNRYEAYSASCHTIAAITSISGHICSRSEHSSLNYDGCNRTDTTHGFCLVKGMTSRQEAFDDCLNRNGMLAELYGEEQVIALMGQNRRYWLGIYRPFESTDTYDEGRACLAVTKVNDILYLDPDDCMAQKSALCTNTFMPTSSQITTSMPINSSSGDKTGETIDQSINSNTNNESAIEYILPTLCFLALLISLVVLIIFIKRRKRGRQHAQNIYDEMCEIDNYKNCQTLSSISSYPNIDVDSRCNIDKPSPDKPVRTTLRRKTQPIDYENYTLNSKKRYQQEDIQNKNNREKPTKEYDKINFTTKTKQVDRNVEDTNIYHHVVDGNCVNYDTIKSTKSCHSKDRVDTSYSHMKNGFVIYEYCDLVPSENNNINVAKQSMARDGNKSPPPRFVIIGDEPLNPDDDDADNEVDKYNEDIEYTEIATVENTIETNKEDIAYSEIEIDASNNVDQNIGKTVNAYLSEHTVDKNLSEISATDTSTGDLGLGNMCTSVQLEIQEATANLSKEREVKAPPNQLNYVDVEQNDETQSDDENKVS